MNRLARKILDLLKALTLWDEIPWLWGNHPEILAVWLALSSAFVAVLVFLVLYSLGLAETPWFLLDD